MATSPEAEEEAGTAKLRMAAAGTASAPSSFLGQGTVDRLATYFLGKLQETKRESGLGELQASVQLKFYAAERTLREHAQDIGVLRSEMQSFWDKAPSFFLHKFSSQLETLNAGRSEKTELALSRFEQKMDDEIKNMANQLGDLSTKLAVGTAALNASVDEIQRKTRQHHNDAAEGVRRCEAELHAKLSAQDALSASYRSEVDLERSKACKAVQECQSQAQGKINSLEAIIRRQSEELAAQAQKLDALGKDIQRLSWWTSNQEKTTAINNNAMAQLIAARREQLAMVTDGLRRAEEERREAAQAATEHCSRTSIDKANGDGEAATHKYTIGRGRRPTRTLSPLIAVQNSDFAAENHATPNSPPKTSPQYDNRTSSTLQQASPSSPVPTAGGKRHLTQNKDSDCSSARSTSPDHRATAAKQHPRKRPRTYGRDSKSAAATTPNTANSSTLKPGSDNAEQNPPPPASKVSLHNRGQLPQERPRAHVKTPPRYRTADMRKDDYRQENPIRQAVRSTPSLCRQAQIMQAAPAPKTPQSVVLRLRQQAQHREKVQGCSISVLPKAQKPPGGKQPPKPKRILQQQTPQTGIAVAIPATTTKKRKTAVGAVSDQPQTQDTRRYGDRLHLPPLPPPPPPAIPVTIPKSTPPSGPMPASQPKSPTATRPASRPSSSTSPGSAPVPMSRAEATRAFVKHVKEFAQRYNADVPRSERQFIWQFLDGIPDASWAAHIQEQLLKSFPTAVRPSLGIRAKHAINFDAGLTWRHVVALIRNMQQKPVPVHLVA